MRFSARQNTLIFIGVLMSFNAKNARAKMLFIENSNNPGARHISAIETRCVASGPNFPCSMNNILARAFFALNDIKTPMKISVFCLALNLIFAIYLVQQYREAGLAVANTVSAIFNTALLFYALRHKLKGLEMQGLIGSVLTLGSIAAVAGGAAYYGFRAWDQHFGHEAFYAKLGAVFVPGALAGIIYWSLAVMAKVPAATEVTAMLKRKLRP